LNKSSFAARRPPGWLVFVAAMSVVGPLTIDMYLPGFPSIEREFREQGVERTMAAYMIGIAVAQLFFGPISDRYGLTPQQFGWQIGLNGVAFMSASRLNMIGLRNAGPEVLLARGIWRPTIVGLLLVAASLYAGLPLWSVIVLQFCFFISVGLLNPNVAALGLAPHGKEAGAASALMGSIQSAVAMVFGSAIAIFNDATLRPLTLIMTTGAICAWLSFRWVRRAHHGGASAAPL
jgi:MFS family permease